jgi:two-component system NtrC family sensor kinase
MRRRDKAGDKAVNARNAPNAARTAVPNIEERYRLVIEAVAEGIYEWSTETNHLELSTQLNEMFGFERGELTSASWLEHVHPDDRNPYRDATVAYFKKIVPHFACEYRVLDKSGQWRWVSDRASSIRDADGRVVRLIGAITDISELKSREAQLRESLQQQTATADMLKAISRSAFDLQTVLNTLVESVTRLCEADHAWLFQREGECFRWVAGYGHATDVHAQIRDYFTNRDVPVDRGSVTGRTALEGRVVHVPDVLADREYTWSGAQKIGGYRAALGAPLLHKEKVVGVIFIVKTVPQPFTVKQIELATTFAAQAVIAIENTRLLNELRQRTDDLSESLEQQTATSEVLKVISSSPGQLEPVFNAMLESAVRICGANFGNLFVREGDALRIRATYGAPPAYIEFLDTERLFRLDPKFGLGRLVRTKELYHLADISAVATYGDKLREATIHLAGARTLIALPMLKNNEVIGAIVIYRQEVQPFTDKQIELVKNFAAQAVIAIENTRLLSELRESLQQQTATADVLKVISSSPGDLGPVFDAMLANAVRICEANFGVLFRSQGAEFYPAAWAGVPLEYEEFLRRRGQFRPTEGAPLDRLLRTKQLVFTVDELTERHPGPAAEFGGARSLIAVPMFKDDELVGAIVIYRQEVRPFTERQVALVSSFANQAVIAIENTRLLNELRESLQQQTATADVLKVISRSTFDLQTVLDTLLQSAATLCRADRAAMRLLRDGAYHTVAMHGFSPQHVEYMKSHATAADRTSIAGRAVLEGKAVQVADVQSDPELTLLRGAPGLANVGTLLGVPMLREGTPIGVLVLSRERVEPFTDKQIELVSTFADQAVIAIENVRLFENVETRTRELAKSLEDLRNTQDRLVQTQKLASLGQLTAGIAHEIKNPLNFVNNFSGISAELITELQEALADVSLNEKTRIEITELMDTLRGNLNKVVQHGKRADAIVKNMLLHSREGSGEHRVVDINPLVEESLNLAYHGARAEKQGFNITMERSLDPDAGQADVFPQDITRVLLNLISNGFYAATKRKAEADGDGYEPTLLASTRSLGDRVEIRVRDNGTGIPPEVKEKMFNPFFTTKPAGEGTGLGLSICHDIIVKQHGGSIEVDTKPGEFTEVRITLPRTAVPV